MVDSLNSKSCKEVLSGAKAESHSVARSNILSVVRHPIGGILTYLKYVYPHLDRDRFNITILAPTTPQITAVLNAIPGIRTILFKSQGRWPLVSLFFRITHSLITGSYALWHSQGATAGALMSIFGLAFRRPHVITLHETFDKHFFLGVLAPLKRRILAFLFARADIINVVTADARTNLLEYFPELTSVQDRIVVIHNGVDVTYLTEPLPEILSIHEQLKIPMGPHVLGYFGRFMPEKGFPILIDAMALLARQGQESRYVVVAVGSGAYEREYRSRIAMLGLAASFRFVEYQSDIRGIYRQVDAVVIPSRREAFALVAVEALVMGVPVIASDCIGLREVVQGSPAILVEQGNVESLASGIERSFASDSLRQATDYRQTASETYDSRNTASRLTELFGKSLSRTSV